jgi:hypothetical protein
MMDNWGRIMGVRSGVVRVRSRVLGNNWEMMGNCG